MQNKINLTGVFLSTLLCLVFVFMNNSSEAGITDVYILPSEPTIEDDIEIITSGVEATNPVEIDSVDFFADDHILQLDLYLSVGVFQMVTPWEYSEDIGILALGEYDLTVRTFVNSELDDTYSENFIVVPEPTSGILVLILGVFVLRYRGRKTQNV